MAVAFLVVMRTRPAGPSGLSPSRSAELDKSSSTTTHGWLVSASQLMKRPATVSASPAGSAPVATTAAPAPARPRAPVGTCLPPARYKLPAAVRVNAVGRDGELCRSRPGLPEAIILGVTLHRSCCHAGLPERYRTRRYDLAHLVIMP